LTGLHACRRNAHYVVRDGVIELLDDVTGRIAAGRVWSRGLHTVVALKEGLKPAVDTDTAAQITFQRFFQRYWRLGGLSGTLFEARQELKTAMGASVVRIPLHLSSQRKELPMYLFDNAEARWDAVCKRVSALRSAGRPVLVGTDSVADSERLSERLQAAGVAHRVLNALNDADEADIVAAAGRAGQVTVATRMAGRGTDIKLDAAARIAGGLHVLSCQQNPSSRLDRQLAGRAARHGDPGSAESWLLWSSSEMTADPLWHQSTLWKICRKTFRSMQFASLIRAVNQRREEHRRALLRRELLRQDQEWERRLSFAGLSS
ncbi:MAG: preprotein translocase subunit SecA, partial [Propionivibrio sp.]